MLYFVNKQPQANGDHEVHTEKCSRLPAKENRHELGPFSNCESAVKKAKELYSTADGCYWCCNDCHKS